MFAPPAAVSPHASFCCYYENGELQAIRDRRWKLHFPHGYRTLAGGLGGRDGTPASYRTVQIGPALFDLKRDIGETQNVATDHPDVVARLQQRAAVARASLGDTLTQ